MTITVELSIDLRNQRFPQRIRAMQADANTRIVEMSLYDGGVGWTVPDGVAAAVGYRKPDGTAGLYDKLPDGTDALTISGNTVTAILAPQVLTAPGIVYAVIILTDDSMRQLSTFPFHIYVEKNPAAGLVVSDNYINVVDAIGDLNTLVTEDKTSLVAAINEIARNNGGTISDKNVDHVGVEPAEDDIPKVFFGAALPQTKDDTIMSFRYISKTKDISGYCKNKAQGDYTMNFPKKNQTVKLYSDAECTEKLKVDFKGWGKQNKFCFKANWSDLTHARNIVSARLWGDVVKSRADYAEIPELLKTSPNQGAVDGFPVKVYANGIYQGRYTINIPKDAWMANMDDELNTHCILCGEDFNSSCFRAEAVIDGTDWTDEIHDDVPATILTRWNEIITFVQNSTDEEFTANLASYFDVQSLIDYYCYSLISTHYDNFAGNQVYLTYDGLKWFASAYDMDSTWGLGTTMGIISAEYPRSSYHDFGFGEGNLLYIRLESLFIEKIKQRYNDLKNDALSIENVINRFERFVDICPPHLVYEDYAATTADGAFVDIPYKDTCTIQQVRENVVKRYAYCDTYIDSLGTDTTLLYSLPQATTFVGANEQYIDTGVKLFDTAKDFTVVIDYESASDVAMFRTVLSCHNNNSETAVTNSSGFFFRTNSKGVGIIRCYSDSPVFNGDIGSDTSRVRVAFTYKQGLPEYCAYKFANTDEMVELQKNSDVTYTSVDYTAVIGAARPSATGSVGWYWSGTVYSCEIYNRAMTETEIAEKLA